MTKVTTLSHKFSDKIRKLLSDQQPEFVHTHGQPDGVGTVQYVDKIAKSIRKLKTDDAFKSWNNLKIPIDTERIRLLFSKISTEFGLRLSTSSPTTYKADTSTIPTRSSCDLRVLNWRSKWIIFWLGFPKCMAIRRRFLDFT